MSSSRRAVLRSGTAAAVGLAFAQGCNRGRSSSAQEVVVYTSVDQVFSEPVFRAF